MSTGNKLLEEWQIQECRKLVNKQGGIGSVIHLVVVILVVAFVIATNFLKELLPAKKIARR